MDTSKFEYLTIEPSKYGPPNEVSVKGYRRVKDGVLKGQLVGHFIDTFPSTEAAREAFPDELGNAEAGPSGHTNTFHHLPDDQEPPVGNQKMKPNGLYDG